MKKVAVFIISLIASLVLPTSASAVNVPEFPTCPFPGGEIIANYNSGTHGVPGDATTYRGEDTVYKLNDAQVVQCLCPENENTGIQTLWWKAQDTSVGALDNLKRQGWIVIPNGALWGLDDAIYVAKNSEFVCAGTGGSNGSILGSTTDKILGVTSYAATGFFKENFTMMLASLVIVMSATYIYKKT